MSEFDPSKPGQLVHDRLNDEAIEWQPERHGRQQRRQCAGPQADSYAHDATAHVHDRGLRPGSNDQCPRATSVRTILDRCDEVRREIRDDVPLMGLPRVGLDDDVLDQSVEIRWRQPDEYAAERGAAPVVE